ncbi:methyltransferase [Kutzneria viridogrisea]|uniref:C-methyltransferase n=1 Tax=Kutzneria viridogrisea TaxID=47990 RepID=A0ABR6BAG0_9PSEU|nr:C-methyltransferase [Kutzneria viridogrisea]
MSAEVTAEPNPGPSMAVPPAVHAVRDLALSCARAAAVRAAIQLGVADTVGEEPMPLATLATAVGAKQATLHRLLRALATYGVFTVTDDGTCAHNEVSRMLRSDAERTMKHMVLWVTEPWAWEVWPHLGDAIRTGENPFTKLHGREFFDYLHAEAPDSAKVFDQAMTQSSQLSVAALVNEISLAENQVFADIGGGQGSVLAAVLERSPTARGALLDLPEVLDNADQRLRPGGALADRVELMPGDSNAEVPVKADVYLLKNLLEWDDESTVRTLRNVAASAAPGARVLVVENLLDGSPEIGFTTAMDLLLLCNVGGRKHTKAGLTDLCERAGLRVLDVRPVNAYLHLVEASVA